jgi:hypothetical protein
MNQLMDDDELTMNEVGQVEQNIGMHLEDFTERLNDQQSLFAYKLPFHVNDVGYMMETFHRLARKKKRLEA